MDFRFEIHVLPDISKSQLFVLGWNYHLKCCLMKLFLHWKLSWMAIRLSLQRLSTTYVYFPDNCYGPTTR